MYKSFQNNRDIFYDKLVLNFFMNTIAKPHVKRLSLRIFFFFEGDKNKALLDWLGVSKKVHQVPDVMSFVVEGILVGTKYHNACNRMNNGLTKIASQDISTCSNITTNKNLKKNIITLRKI